MSEFKFACPVCGQHITADSANAGSQLECPTCYRKIVVPQAPASGDAKFILSAAEANKPRPPQPTVPKLEPISAEPVRPAVPVALVVVLILLLALGAAAVVFRGKIFGRKAPDKEQLAGESGGTNEDNDAPGKKNPAVQVHPITNDIAWNLDLADAAVPETAAAGKLWGEFVSCNRNFLQGGALNLHQGIRGLPDLTMAIVFFTKQPEDLRNKSFTVGTNDTLAPHVVLRWREGKSVRTQTFTNGYAMKLELGEISGNHITGKVYVSLPDDDRSRIAGTFTADVRKPAPPKPRAPKPK